MKAQQPGRVVVTYQAWDSDGTPLADPPLVFELESSHLSQYRSVEPLYGPDGKAHEMLVGATLLNIVGRVIDPAHPTPFRMPWNPEPRVATPPKDDDPENLSFADAVKGPPVVQAKSVEDLEREMADWVRGVKDEHDEVVDSLKAQHVPVLEGRLAVLEATKAQLVARYDKAIADVVAALRHARPADPGGLKVEDGQIVDTIRPLVDATTAARRLAGLPDETPKEG